MRIVITGADGFLGQRLVDLLLAAGRIGHGFEPFSILTLVDLQWRRVLHDTRVQAISGSFTDAPTRGRALAGGVDVLFHLASLPGGAAQAHFERGRAVNLDGSMALVDAVAARNGKPPIVVYTSSIAALGAAQGGAVTEDTPPRPRGSYGCHKLMLEIYLADLTARGWIDARSVRPAGIVARPRAAFSGFATAWMSEIFHAMCHGQACQVPLAAATRTWLQSVDCVAQNVLHAATLPAAHLPAHRAWTLPALNPSMAELVQALGQHTAAARGLHIGFASAPNLAPRPSMPAQQLPLTEALGFEHDGTLDVLVQRTLAQLRRPAP